MDDSKRECNEEINSILKELESLKLCGPLKQSNSTPNQCMFELNVLFYRNASY